VETDRIGSGAFFWALPSKGMQSRLNLIDNVKRHTGELDRQTEETLAKAHAESAQRDPEGGARDRMLAELAHL
jgi:hypothetical protein